MIKITAVLLATLCLLIHPGVGFSVLGEDREVRLVKTDAVFHDLESYKREAKGDTKFTLEGKVYHATYDTSRAHIGVTMLGDSAEASEQFEIKGERDYYFDAKNHAVFTVSRRTTENGVEKKSLRGNILLPDSSEHLVLEPHEDSEMNQEGFHMYSRVYKTSRNNGLPYEVANATRNRDFVELPYKSTSNEPATTTGAVNNYVELFMVADFWYYQALVKRVGKSDDSSIALFTEAYFAQLEYLVSQCYERSLASVSNLKIKVVATQIYILKTAQSSPFTGTPYYTTLNGASKDQSGKQYINADTALDALNSWAVTAFKGKNYDAVVGITASNICGVDAPAVVPTDDGVVGLAPVGGICLSGSNAFIVEDWLDFSRAYTIAHELGHNLGAQHDDYYNDASCTDDDYYIMAPSNEPNNFLNSFYFSPCSIKVFVNQIYTKNKASCLANAVQADSDITRFASYFPGQIYNLTQQCQLEFGPTYFADVLKDSDTPGSDAYICENIFCTDGGTLTKSGNSVSYKYGWLYGSQAYEKSSCGNGKWCVAGACVADSSAPKGDIVVESHPFCQQVAQYYGKSYICSLFYGACYQYCNPTAKVVQQLTGQTMANWLSSNTVDNTHLL